MRCALVFGYGQKADGTLAPQTADRCDTAIRLYREAMINKIFLTVSAKQNGVLMAKAMRDYFVSHAVKIEDIKLHCYGGNTAGEMDVFIFAAHNYEITEFVFVSTWYHIPRIVWLAFCRRLLIPFTVKVAWKHVHWKKDVLVEVAKIVNAVLRPLRSSKVVSCS